MGLRKLDTLDTYEQINGGAHRKPASIVGTPSLVRRIGFWNTGFDSAPVKNEADKDAAPQDQSKLDPSDRADAYARYLKDLTSVLQAAKGKNIHIVAKDFVHESGLVPQSGTVTIVRFWWYGIRATLRLEYHTEYITLSSILDLSVKANPRYKVVPGDMQSRLGQTFKLLGTLFASPRPDERVRYRRLGYFQDVVWEEFEHTILNGRFGRRRILQGNLGQVFADFRGIVTGSRIEKERAWPAMPAHVSSAIRQSLVQPFQEDLPRRRDRPRRSKEPPQAWAKDTLTRLWPLMEAHDFLRDYEFTVGGFLDGRVLYVSALGPQPLKNENETWPWTPVYYYLHAYTDDEWQIGRLVDRINTLGTLRLASTMEAKSLLEAGKIADELASDIDDVANFLQQAIKDTKSPTSPGADCPGEGDAEVSCMTQVDEADERMVRIQAKLRDIDSTVSGNIEYRLERSHYYLEQFQKEAVGLREARVEGYQKYQEFVMRRMSGVFGYVELMRTRMASIYSAIGGLGRQYASLKIASVTCSIDGLISQMRGQNERMTQQHEDMETQEKEIRKIQEFGEVALIGVLIPYYVGTSIFHYLLHFEGLAEQAAWLVILTFFAFVLSGRLRKQSAHDVDAAKRLRPIRKLVRSYIGIIWGLFGIALLAEHWEHAEHWAAEAHRFLLVWF